MNIIDSLVVTLNLDSSKFTKGQKEAQEALKKTEHASNKTAKELADSGKKAAAAFGNLKSELLAIGALLAGGFGLKSFIMGTVQQTAALGRLSANLDMSRVSMSEWQHAVVMAGGTSEEATAQLQSHASALAKFKTTGNTEGILSATQKWGGYSGKTFVPTQNTTQEDLLKQQADIIKGIIDDPKKGIVVANEAAKEMGISAQGVFNILKGGSGDLKRFLDAQKEIAEAESKLADQAEELRQGTIKLKNEFMTLALDIMPILIEALRGFTEFLDSKEFKEKFQAFKNLFTDGDFSNAVKTAVLDIKFFARVISIAAKAIGKFAEFLFAFLPGGSALLAVLKEALQDIAKKEKSLEADDERDAGGGVKLTPGSKNRLGSSVSDATPATGDNKSIVGKLVSFGWTPEQAAGIAGNLQLESAGFKPNAVGDKGSAYGLAQWHDDRQQEFKKLFGKKIQGSSLDEQLEFVNYELTRGKEKAAGDKIRSTRTAQDAALATRQHYERANPALAHDDRRISNAKALLAAYGSSNATNASSLPMAFKPKGANNSTTSNHDVETNINTINIQTQATDSNGIASSIGQSMTRNFNFFAPQNANTGLS